MIDSIKREDAIKVVHEYFIEALYKEPTKIDEDGDKVFADMRSVNKLLTHNKTISKALKELPSPEDVDRHYIKIYADDEPSVKAEKLYQICDETQNREVAEWLKEYFPLSDDNWIPVSEKLPDEDDYNEYLVIDDRGYMAVGNYRHDAKAWDSGNFGWLEIRDKTDEFPWGIGKVVAWYKPKPYKESKVKE